MKFSRYFRIVLFAFSLVCLNAFSLYAEHTNTHTSKIEKKTVKVAYFFGEGFQECSPIDGHRSGYGYEFLQSVAYFAGWTYEYVDTNWIDGIEMLEKGEVDIIAEVTKTPEREKKMLFADREMGSEEYYIYTNPSRHSLNASEISSLNGKTVGINAGSYQLELFKKWSKENNIRCKIIEYYDEELRNNDFLTGKLDAAVDYDFYLDHGWRPFLNIGKSNYYMAVAKNRRDILDELNAAQASLFESSPFIIERLKNTYFPHEVALEHMSAKEEEWIKAHLSEKGKIKMGFMDGYLPYCARNKDTGKLEGALAVFLEKVKSTFGIEIEAIPFTDQEKLYDAVKNNEICSCFPLYNDLWQSEELGIMQTSPFIDFPQALIFKKGLYSNTGNIENFAVPLTSNIQTSYIHDKFPNSRIEYFNNHASAMRAVNSGKADAMFINTFILSRFYDEYQRNKNTDMYYMPNDCKVSIGVSYSSPELLSIYNKTIILLDEPSISSALIHNSRLENPYSFRLFMREYAIPIVFFLMVIAAIIILREKHSRQKMQKAYEAAKEAFNAANKANAAKTEFMASMSHDIRTPMNAIIGMTAIAGANMDDKEKVQHCLSEITISSKHLLGLINEVLDMNKIESGKVSLNLGEFSLSSMVDEFVSVAAPLIKGNHHDFNVNIHDIKHENVIGDAGRIQQCLMNFMSNAVKYTPSGGKIRLSITEKKSASPKFGCYEFIFEDNGIGMSEEFQKVMFDPFTRADDLRAQKQQGTGLGMSITQNIIHMMNGDIKVESALNKGTKITTTIMLELRENDSDLDIAPLADLPILVADDDKIACETTCFVLNELGMKGEYVLSGKEAVEKIVARHEAKNENDFFAAIIDWKMPEMDGIETTRAIRAAVGPSVPIIIISAYDWSDIENEAREAGASAFIAKPLFKSKVAHTFLELTGNEANETEKPELEKYREENFSDYRVLLVEDIEINAEIAKEILMMTGLSVDIATNGEEAVEKMNAVIDGYYDLIFMDIQMPVLNGYEATKKIRASEREYLKTVPIVAMSANAFTEDIQKSLASGMNEYIAKPLDFDRLLTVLNRWIKK